MLAVSSGGCYWVSLAKRCQMSTFQSIREMIRIQNMLYIIHNGNDDEQRRAIMSSNGKWCKRDSTFVAINFECEGCVMCEGKAE